MIRKFIPNHTVCKEFTRINTGRKMHIMIRLFTNSDGTDQLYKINTFGDDSYVQRMGYAGMQLGHWLATEKPGRLEESEYPYVYFEDMDDCPFHITQYKLYPLAYFDGSRFFKNDNGDAAYLMTHHETTWIPESEVAMIED